MYICIYKLLLTFINHHHSTSSTQEYCTTKPQSNGLPMLTSNTLLPPSHFHPPTTSPSITTCGRSVIARATKKSPRNMGVGWRVLVTGLWVYDSAGVFSSRLVCQLATMSLYVLCKIHECWRSVLIWCWFWWWNVLLIFFIAGTVEHDLNFQPPSPQFTTISPGQHHSFLNTNELGEGNFMIALQMTLRWRLGQDHWIRILTSPSHCKIKGNDRADALAKEATQMAWNMPIGTLRAFTLCWAKATTQTAWIRDWQRTPKKGQFTILNRIPPSLNPTKHFTELKDHHEVFGLLIWCRTGQAYIGEFRRQFFPEKSVECKCGETLQTCEHILRTCARYTDHQENLQNEDREITLPELLGTPKGITALTKFLKESGAFTFTRERYMPKITPTFEDEQNPQI